MYLQTMDREVPSIVTLLSKHDVEKGRLFVGKCCTDADVSRKHWDVKRRKNMTFHLEFYLKLYFEKERYGNICDIAKTSICCIQSVQVVKGL